MIATEHNVSPRMTFPSFSPGIAYPLDIPACIGFATDLHFILKLGYFLRILNDARKYEIRDPVKVKALMKVKSSECYV